MIIYKYERDGDLSDNQGQVDSQKEVLPEASLFYCPSFPFSSTFKMNMIE